MQRRCQALEAELECARQKQAATETQLTELGATNTELRTECDKANALKERQKKMLKGGFVTYAYVYTLTVCM